MKAVLDTKNVPPLGTQTIKFSNLTGSDPTGVQYIDQVILLWNGNFTTSDGGGVTPYDLHNILSQLTISDGTGPWGPNNVSGVELAAARYLATAHSIPFASNINGDSAIAEGTSNATRQWQTIWDFSIWNGNYSPATAVFGPAGFINITTALTPNAAEFLTINSLTVTAIAITHGERKLRAVPRMLFQSNVLPSKNYDLNASGLFLLHALENTVEGTGIVASDITNLTLTGADGTQILQTADILGTRPPQFQDNPEISGAHILRSFCDPIGGTNPYVAPVIPFRQTSNAKTGGHASAENNPVTSKISGILTGGLDYGDYNNLTVNLQVMEQHAVAKQLSALGAPSGSAKKTVHETSHGGKPSSTKLHGFVPQVLTA
jgi:hypothetical protein